MGVTTLTITGGKTRYESTYFSFDFQYFIDLEQVIVNVKANDVQTRERAAIPFVNINHANCTVLLFIQDFHQDVRQYLFTGVPGRVHDVTWSLHYQENRNKPGI